MNDDAGPAEKRICLGLITGARGLKGEVWIRTFTAEPADVAAYGPPTDDGERRYRLRIIERRDDRVVARIEGVSDRSAAEALKGTHLYVERAALPVPDVDEFYHADLIGCVALVAAGEETAMSDASGRVSAVHDFGGGAVLEIDFVTGESLMVPFSRTCVPEVDLARGRVRIVPPPGLLAEPAAPASAKDMAGEEAPDKQ
jgi:16S rRNA processing protein RimM